jgi:hypothetical protein
MIERLVHHRRGRGQFRFAAEAKRNFPPRDDVLLAKSDRGLHVLARDTRALARSLDLVRSAYGHAVAIEPVDGDEPLIEVRVGLENRHLPRVRAALRRRGANPSEEYLGPHYSVLRFQAAPASLLGLAGELAALTDGRATNQAVLLRSHR